VALKGPQWENTFWNETDDEGNDVVKMVNFNSDTYGRANTAAYTPEEAEALPGAQQGMLFHPATGTGRQADPLISPERRRAAVEGAFGLSDSKEDAENIRNIEAQMGKNWTGRKKASASEIDRGRKLAIDSLVGSGISTHEMEQDADKFPQVVATDRSVSSRGGAYWSSKDAAGTRIQVNTRKFQVPGRKAVEGGELVANRKPLDIGSNNTGMHRIGTFLDSRTGNDLAWAAMSDEEKDAHTPEGYPEGATHRHLFTTPGDPEKYYSEEVDRGWTDRYLGDNYIDKDMKYYVRRKATAWEDDPDSRVTKTVTDRTVPHTTMVHEVGHGRHIQGKRDDLGVRQQEDPLYEGVADAYADAHTGVRGRDVPVGNMTHNSWGDHYDIEEVGRGDNVPNGRNSYQFSSWGNATDQALYTAMRHHVQVTGDVPASLYRSETAKELVPEEPPLPGGVFGIPLGTPERDKAERDNNRALDRRSDWAMQKSKVESSPNKVALGRLLHEQPHVLELFQTGGESAHSKKMQAAAADALGHYKGLLDAKNAADGRAPAGPEAGWRATEEGLAQHNALRQGWTLPLADPETGEQYDNTVPHSGDPLFPVGGNPVRKK